jgi:MarR family transcriptional regulator, multiple antibiotic resistance protein MarR
VKIMTDAIVDLFSEEQFRCTDSLGHMLTRARNLLAKSLDAALAEYDITHTQGSILWLLASGNISTATDLARELYVDAASMTRMIDRLEKRKLTVRMPRGDDRRVINLRLTPTGHMLAEKLPGLYAAAMNRSFTGFTVEEVAVLRRLLGKLLGIAFTE